MQLTSTVFVLGAGSSAEFGLPAGAGLASAIASSAHFYFQDGLRLTSGDKVIWEQIRRRSRNDAQSFLEAGRIIWRGIPFSRSVDDFLYNHGDNPHVVELGKVGIVRSILSAEKSSRLAKLDHPSYDSEEQLHKMHDTWLFRLLRILQTDVKRPNLQYLFDGVSFINFNYDRCLETFLYHAIQCAYSVDGARAAEVLGSLRVERPYGRVGALPWEAGNAAPKVKFGAPGEQVDLFALAQNVSTFTEQVYDEKILSSLRSTVSSAKRVIFLGFGFHKQNMRLLRVPRAPESLPVYATVMGTSDADRTVFASLIAESLRGGWLDGIEFAPTSCANFVDEYGLSLAAQR